MYIDLSKATIYDQNGTARSERVTDPVLADGVIVRCSTRFMPFLPGDMVAAPGDQGFVAVAPYPKREEFEVDEGPARDRRLH